MAIFCAFALYRGHPRIDSELFSALSDPKGLDELLHPLISFQPAIEELLSRGLIYTLVRKRSGVFAAFMVSSALFALSHGPLMAGVPIVRCMELFLSGLVFCALRERFGNLSGPIAAHTTLNVLAASALLGR